MNHTDAGIRTWARRPHEWLMEEMQQCFDSHKMAFTTSATAMAVRGQRWDGDWLNKKGWRLTCDKSERNWSECVRINKRDAKCVSGKRKAKGKGVLSSYCKDEKSNFTGSPSASQSVCGLICVHKHIWKGSRRFQCFLHSQAPFSYISGKYVKDKVNGGYWTLTPVWIYQDSGLRSAFLLNLNCET